MYLVTPQQMKIIEKNANDSGASYLTLMQNAGYKLAQFIAGLSVDLTKGIVIFCGSGNNGGDGFVLAKLLSEMGIPVTAVLMCGEPTTEISAQSYCDLSNEAAEVLFLNDNIDKIFNKISAAGLIVDSVFGTGYHGDLPPQIKACFSYASRAQGVKLAVDIPSGGNSTTGEAAEGTMKCSYTVTFANKKIGMEFLPLKDYCGEIIIEDIGIPNTCYTNIDHPICKIEFDNMEKIIPKRSPTAHKGDFGRLVNVSGSRRMSGACAMSTLAALRSGVGICTVATSKSVVDSLSSSIYEAMYLPLKETPKGEISSTNGKEILAACEKASAVTIGCGLGVSEDTTKLVEFLLENITCPIILDADGINCIAPCIDIIKNTRASIIVTPHPAEMARLLSITTAEVLKDRLSCAIKLSTELGITVVAKGAPTIIAGESGFCYLNTTGNAGLSRGGSGDVLTGMIGSFVAQGISPTDAAVAGVYLHGLAADHVAEKLSMQGMLPTDVIAELPLVFKQMNR